jgi:hypothetical protein
VTPKITSDISPLNEKCCLGSRQPKFRTFSA